MPYSEPCAAIEVASPTTSVYARFACRLQSIPHSTSVACRKPHDKAVLGVASCVE